MQPARPGLEPGLVLADRYRLERHLSAGGMGTVWCATDLQIGGEVAIKLLADDQAGEEERSRLVREVKTARAVQHSHVIRVFDGLETEHGPIMIMELLRGESLRERLERETRLSPAATVAIFLPVLSAVGAAHEKGVIHRDIKPANIFLCEPEGGASSVKVLDFGIAKLQAQGRGVDFGDLTRSGAILGTPPYMSPEQAFGDKDIDHRTDIWSLGIVLYECLSGILPTRADGTRQVFKIIAIGRIPPLREAAPEVPPGLASLVDRMLAREPRDRPRNLAAIRAELEAFATSGGEDAARPSAPVPAPPASGEQGGVSAPAQLALESKSAGRLNVRVAGLAAVALVVGLVAFAALGDDLRSPSPPGLSSDGSVRAPSASMGPQAAPNFSASMGPQAAPNFSASMGPQAAPNPSTLTAELPPPATTSMSAAPAPAPAPSASATSSLAADPAAKLPLKGPPSKAPPRASAHQLADDSPYAKSGTISANKPGGKQDDPY